MLSYQRAPFPERPGIEGKWKTHLEVKLEGTKKLKGGSDCQLGRNRRASLESCLVNLSTFHCSALCIASMGQRILESIKMRSALGSIAGERGVENKSLKEMQDCYCKINGNAVLGLLNNTSQTVSFTLL